MSLPSALFAVVLVAALAWFARSVRRLVSYLKRGRPENRLDRPAERVRRVLAIAFGQRKLLREPTAGLLHFMIFWGFVTLLLAVLESILEGFGGSLAFLGPLYGPLVFLQDIVGAIVIAAVTVSILRRLVAPPKRLQVEGHAKWDAILILALILTVMVTMFGQNASRILMGNTPGGAARVVSSIIASWCAPADAAQAEVWHSAFFWAHMLTVLGFLNYLPYSKHLHILTSIPNVYLSETGPRGALKPINLADETLTRYGVTDVDELTWKQLLDGFTCTECGRCSAACPANTTGKLLSPRKVIVDVRARTMEKMPALASGPDGAPEKTLAHQLLDNFVTEEELWACTTCMACVHECPVMIEHVGTIVDLRRSLVLNESRFPEELKVTFSNLERNFTPWGFAHAARADWAEGLDVPRMADVRSADVLFWVGCAGAYDARYRKVSQAVARLLKIAGVNFAILGTEERCNGDAARRMGNEYLAQMLITENVNTLAKYRFKKILVTCPHCLQSLAKEYPQFGASYEVVHHTTFLQELLGQGRLRVGAGKRSEVTFHDPCYLGRYNDEYASPRALVEAIPGTSLREMRRSGDRSFCCGAGGGRMWMEEREGKRVNIERTEEALATGADTIGTGCPFCLTMLADGVKAADAEGKVQVRDVAELLLDAVAGGEYEVKT